MVKVKFIDYFLKNKIDNMMGEMYLHLNIKALRKFNGYTQDSFSKVLKVKKATISTYERGVSKPSFSSLMKMREIFKVNLDDFIFKDLRDNPKRNLVNEPSTPYGKLMQAEVIELQRKRIDQLEEVILDELPDRAEKLKIIDKTV